MSSRAAWLGGIAGLVVACLLSALIGAHLAASSQERVTPSPAQSQPDGSVIAAREPHAAPGKAPHMIPRGAVEERRVSVTVQPRAKQPASASGESDQTVTPPPVQVDLSLVRMDGGRRVIASSPDGDVVGALDVPIEAAALPASRPWAAGISCDPLRCAAKTLGVVVQRDLDRLRIGGEIYRDRFGNTGQRVSVMWRW